MTDNERMQKIAEGLAEGLPSECVAVLAVVGDRIKLGCVVPGGKRKLLIEFLLKAAELAAEQGKGD